MGAYPVVQSLDPAGNKVVCVMPAGVAPPTDQVGNMNQITKKTITSAQLLALRATPQTVVAGIANCIFVVNSISYRYVYATAAYTLNAGTLILYYGPSANAHGLHADQSAVLTNTANRNIVGIPALAVAADTDANNLGASLILANAGVAEFTLGGGTLEVVVEYMTVLMP